MNHKKVKTELRCRKSIQRLMVLGMLTAGSLGAYAQNTVTGTVVDASVAYWRQRASKRY